MMQFSLKLVELESDGERDESVKERNELNAKEILMKKFAFPSTDHRHRRLCSTASLT